MSHEVVYASGNGLAVVAVMNDNYITQVRVGDIISTDTGISPHATKLRRLLHRYLRGDRVEFDFAVDLSSVTEFGRKVLKRLQSVGPGETVTYGQLAAYCDCPGGARAIGQVMSKNPVPVIVACHRVIAHNRYPGGYGSGLAVKRKLLELEGVYDIRW